MNHNRHSGRFNADAIGAYRISTLEPHFVHANQVESIVIPEAIHYVHLDRPERGRDQFIEEVLYFYHQANDRYETYFITYDVPSAFCFTHKLFRET